MGHIKLIEVEILVVVKSKRTNIRSAENYLIFLNVAGFGKIIIYYRANFFLQSH